MRCSKSFVFALLALASSTVVAGPTDRNAASKANGDWVGTPAAQQRVTRSYSYNTYAAGPATVAPQPSTATPAPPVQAQAQATPAPAPQPERAAAAPVRRYSYQPAYRSYSAPQTAAPYTRVDKKILGY